MRLKLDIEVPHWTKWLIGGLALGIVVGAIGARVYADTISIKTKFADGEILSASEMSTNFQKLQDGVNQAAPPGTVVAFAGSTAPSGWLLCDGGTVSRTQYAALFAVVGVTYGIGDAVSTFKLPDLQSRTVVAAGKGSGLTSHALGEVFGEEAHTLSDQEMPSHTHAGTTSEATGLASWFTEWTGGSGDKRGLQPVFTTYGGLDLKDHNHPFTSNATGGGTSHNIMQPSIALNYIIKY